DILSIVGIIEDKQYIYPSVIFDSLQYSKQRFKESDIYKHITVSQDDVENAIHFIENNVTK
ncbi:hypothetical protein ACOIC7_29435, partial [Klebsiella pneumoniae]|uniref:hypothetical protein n=2 Tax=Enterobacterales TaxID=91347 RepID=UPI003B5AFB3F